ncbi:hypothetical protein [Lysinibacillus boronitolerans]|uniref:hypothetical protein n=1 Tax=Lysinibacillus boronitolerans TaxID=309788 RepID=UPI0002EF04AE|nr:hypothetical protein [Lysinibacillus boronitolerans]
MFAQDMIEQAFTRLNNKVSSGLMNLDCALNGGISPELYVFVGKLYDERSALFLHVAEHFIQQGYHVIYYSFYDSLQSIHNKLLLRCDYKLNRNASSTVPTILQELESSPTKLAQFQQHLNLIANKLTVENKPFVKLNELEDLLSAIGKEGKVVVLLDERQLRPNTSIDIEYCCEHLTELQQIAQLYQVPIFSMSTLSKEDYGALQEGCLTSIGIETSADNIVLCEPTTPLSTPYVLNLKVFGKSVNPLKSVPLTYHPSHYFFQDA